MPVVPIMEIRQNLKPRVIRLLRALRLPGQISTSAPRAGPIASRRELNGMAWRTIDGGAPER